MTFTLAVSLLTYIFINSYTPGPGNILALNIMTKSGWKSGRNILYGICAGYFSVQILCAFIVYSLSSMLSSALFFLKYTGIAYLLWLAVHIIRSRPESDSSDHTFTFLSGFLLQFVNVKIYVYGITTLNGYILPLTNKFSVLLLTVVVIAAIGSIATFTWALGGLKLQMLYAKNYRLINWLLGLSLMYCAWHML